MQDTQLIDAIAREIEANSDPRTAARNILRLLAERRTTAITPAQAEAMNRHREEILPP